MNMSRNEKTKLIAGLIAWVLVGVVGFVYFWMQNPERKLNAVISSSDIDLLQKEFGEQFKADSIVYLNSGEDTITAPEKFGNTVVSEKAQTTWLSMLNQVKRTVSSDLRNYFEDPTGVESTGSYKLSGYDEDGYQNIEVRSDGDVSMQRCIYIDGEARTKKETATTSTYVCGWLRIDSETKEIIDFQING